MPEMLSRYPATMWQNVFSFEANKGEMRDEWMKKMQEEQR